MKSNNLSYRVIQLEKQYEKIDNNLEKLMTNDLPHLREDIITLTTRVNVLTAVNIGAVILGIIVSKIL